MNPFLRPQRCFHKPGILLILATCLAFTLFAQTNNWAPIGAVWHYDAFGNDFCFHLNYAGYFTMTSKRDSLVLGKNVRILERRNGGGLSVKERDFIMYEDSGKVYYYHDTRREFMLLYDFNAQPGDTLVLRTDTADFVLELYGPNQSPGLVDTGCVVFIDRVDTVELDGKLRRRQWVYPLYPGFSQRYGFYGTIIEGLGYLQNMFGGYFVASTCYHWGGLRCYQDREIFVQQTPNPCDYIPLVSLEDDLGQPLFRVLSGGAEGEYLLVAQHVRPYAEISCRIFNLSGKELKSFSLTTDSQGRCRASFTLHGQSCGLYMLNLLLEGGKTEWVKLLNR